MRGRRGSQRLAALSLCVYTLSVDIHQKIVQWEQARAAAPHSHVAEKQKERREMKRCLKEAETKTQSRKRGETTRKKESERTAGERERSREAGEGEKTGRRSRSPITNKTGTTRASEPLHICVTHRLCPRSTSQQLWERSTNICSTHTVTQYNTHTSLCG